MRYAGNMLDYVCDIFLYYFACRSLSFGALSFGDTLATSRLLVPYPQY